MSSLNLFSEPFPCILSLDTRRSDQHLPLHFPFSGSYRVWNAKHLNENVHPNENIFNCEAVAAPLISAKLLTKPQGPNCHLKQAQLIPWLPEKSWEQWEGHELEWTDLRGNVRLILAFGSIFCLRGAWSKTQTSGCARGMSIIPNELSSRCYHQLRDVSLLGLWWARTNGSFHHRKQRQRTIPLPTTMYKAKTFFCNPPWCSFLAAFGKVLRPEKSMPKKHFPDGVFGSVE